MAFSQRYLSDTTFLNSSLIYVARFTKSSHITTNSKPKKTDKTLSNVFLMPKCSVNKVLCANLRTFSRKHSGTTSCNVTLVPFVNCLYNKPFFRTNLVSPLFKPRLTVMLPDSTLPLILFKFGSVTWACFKASLSSFIFWSGVSYKHFRFA